MEAPHEFFLRFLTCLWSLNKAVDIARSWRPTDADADEPVEARRGVWTLPSEAYCSCGDGHVVGCLLGTANAPFP
jgi:hypothetical protein